MMLIGSKSGKNRSKTQNLENIQGTARLLAQLVVEMLPIGP